MALSDKLVRKLVAALGGQDAVNELVQCVNATAGDVAGLTFEDLTGTCPVAKGGTGATTAEAARAALGLGIEGDDVTLLLPGTDVTMSGDDSLAVGSGTTASGDQSVAFGSGTAASGDRSHAEGDDTTASGTGSHAEGDSTTAEGDYSHAEGSYASATGEKSHAEGEGTVASGQKSHAEGEGTTASGNDSHAEGDSTTAGGYASHAEGESTTASGESGHAEGKSTIASGDYSHAEGESTTASSESGHAEGKNTTASGEKSHAEGESTTAAGYASHAGGKYSVANLPCQYSHGSGVFAATGDAQRSGLELIIETTDDTPANLLIGGFGGVRPTIRTDMTVDCFVRITARKTTDGTVGASFWRRCLIARNTNATALIGSAQTIGTDINASGLAVAVTADDTNDALQVQVTGLAATTIHWVAVVEWGEVG